MQVIESHGARIPIIGFGTMTLKENLCVELVEAALHLGYRHLDTAQNYGNEREVGEGLRASGMKRDEVLGRIGRAHGKTPAQVALRYLEQQNIIPIPRTSKRERLAENLGSLELTLSAAEMAEIDTLKRPDGRIVSPPQAPPWDA